MAAPTGDIAVFFENHPRMVALGRGADATASTPPSKPKAPEAKRSERPRPEAPKATAPKPADTKHVAAAHPPLKPPVSDAPVHAAKDHLVSGSVPIVSSNSFDSRFGAVK
jgi:hypothetical protein